MAIPDHVEGLLHDDTQVHDGVVDLSLASVARVTAPGRVDFGGGELDPADLAPVGTEKRSPDDDYGWWNLEAGRYVLEHNERLAPPADGRLAVQPRDELLARGATHPTLSVRELGPVPLSVGGAGIRLKENARVSTVVRVER